MSAAASERLNRFLARRGVASRRRADELIAAGRVVVNGAQAKVGAVVAPERDHVVVDGRAVGAPVQQTVMLNKPAGFVTTVSDPQHRPTVMRLVPSVPGMVPVGRLDAESRGLLLFTTDGELAHRLTHPRYEVEKVYRVRTQPRAAAAHISSLLRGVALDDGPAKVLRARHSADAIELAVAEGRKREVRRICAAVGLGVVDLQRVSIGPITLGDLREGESRALSNREESHLRSAVGLADG